MGWAATGTALSVEAFVLFGILFFWQIPHFYAIALLFEEDYRKAGFKMLPSEDRVGSQTAWQMLICTILLVGVSVFPFYWGGVSEIYFFGAALMGGAFLALTAQMFVHLKELGCLKMPRRNLARRVFLGSIAYFPILMVFLFLDRIWTVAL
jgi:protoheme IX farnesyltransferase